jgi:hypothetical protein
MYLTITTGAQGEFHLQDPFPAEGYCVKRIAPSTTVTFPVTVIQLNHLKAQLDAAVKAGIVTSYTFDEADQVPSDELLELRNRTAKVATLAVTGGAVPNLVTLGIRKGDIFNMYVAATGVTLSYEVDEVNSATCFTSTVLVVAFDKIAAGDKIYFSRDGVLITGTDRTVAGGITHVIATVSQSPYQRTGFGRFFVKTSDGKPYFITGAGVELNLGMTGSDPLVFKGGVSVATDFPLLADVKTGWLYRVLLDVTDSGGGGRTGTTQSFLAGSEIAWNGTDWTELGAASNVQEVHVAGVFTLPKGSSTTFVDTTTAGAGTSCVLPAASATKLGETVAVGDYTNDCTAHNITIGRTGADTIDGVAADLVLNRNNIFVVLECVSATGWKTVNRIAPVSSAATPAAVGTAAAGTSKVCSPDDHVHDIGVTTVGDLPAVNSITPTVMGRIAAGAAGTALVGNGAGVKPSFQAIAGVALDVLDAVIAVADSASGVDTVLGTVQVNDLAGAPVAHVVEGMILAQTGIYGGQNLINAHVTFSLATTGSILASGNGWCVFKTNATGAFACTLTNASHETVYFSVCSVDGGVDALAAGAIIRGCIPDAATWNA